MSRPEMERIANDLIADLSGSIRPTFTRHARALIGLLEDVSAPDLDDTIAIAERALSALIDASDRLGQEALRDEPALHPPPLRAHRELLSLSAELHRALAPAYERRGAEGR